MSLLQLITKASTNTSQINSEANYPVVLNSEPVLLQLKPHKEEEKQDDESFVTRASGWKISQTDSEVIELGKGFVEKLNKKMKNPKTFNKDGFFDMFGSYLRVIGEKAGVSADTSRLDEGSLVKLIEKFGFLMGRDIKGLVLEACVVLETWEVLESLIVYGLVEHSCSSNLINNLIEKKRSWLVVLCVKHVPDLQTYELMCILKYFLSLGVDGDSSLVNVRMEWESQALSAIEKVKDTSVGSFKLSLARDASLLLMLALDGFSVSELCLHYLFASRNLDDAILGACISKLAGSEIMILIRYVQKWLNKYERFPQVGPCPKAPSVLGLKACEWVPSLEDIVKCLGSVVDEHFSSLVLHKELHEELKVLNGVVDSLTSEARICGIMSNLTLLLKSKHKGSLKDQ